MKGFEIFGRVIISLVGVYIIFRTLQNTFSYAKYLTFNWLAWLVFIILIALGLFLIYMPLQKVLFKK